jgi:hypothetical protein
MGIVKFMATMSLDGFVVGPNQSEENPLAKAAWCSTSGCSRSRRGGGRTASRAARSTRAHQWQTS